jgi:hypothetical protein
MNGALSIHQQVGLIRCGMRFDRVEMAFCLLFPCEQVLYSQHREEPVEMRRTGEVHLAFVRGWSILQGVIRRLLGGAAVRATLAAAWNDFIFFCN